jgi:hypothetical protein
MEGARLMDEAREPSAHQAVAKIPPLMDAMGPTDPSNDESL